MEPRTLSERLQELLDEEPETFDSNDRLALHQQNRWQLHLLLARMTEYVEMGSGNASRYLEYIDSSARNRYEVEHIWANKPKRHVEEFAHAVDFGDFRNRLGGLLLLPKSFNASFGALSFLQKREHYQGQNLLASSLHPQTYEHNPGFRQFIAQSGLPFHAYDEFLRADLEDRQELYRGIAKRAWDPAQIVSML